MILMSEGRDKFPTRTPLASKPLILQGGTAARRIEIGNARNENFTNDAAGPTKAASFGQWLQKRLLLSCSVPELAVSGERPAAACPEGVPTGLEPRSGAGLRRRTPRFDSRSPPWLARDLAYRLWPSGRPIACAFWRSAPGVRFIVFATAATGVFLLE